MPKYIITLPNVCVGMSFITSNITLTLTPPSPLKIAHCAQWAKRGGLGWDPTF